MGTYLIGIDVGTTGSKAMVVDLKGNVIGSGYGEYPCIYPKDNWVEQDAQLLIESTYKSCKDAVNNSGVNPKDIKAVGFSTQRATFALVDDNKEVMGGNFYGWQDNRAMSEIDYITSKMSSESLYRISGMPTTPTFTFEKLIWIMNNEPEKYNEAKYIVQMPEYVMYKFGADDFYCEMANACCSGMMDIRKMTWSKEILDTFGIDEEKLPKLVKPGVPIGKVTKEVSQKTGLAQGTLLCTGTGDQQCAAIGAGVVEPGNASLTLGTAGLLVAGTSEPVLDDMGLMVCASGSEGLYEVEGIQLGAASSYRWIRDVIAEVEKTLGEKLDLEPFELMDNHINKSSIGSNGVIFMPFLVGSGYPYWNAEAKGAFMGLKFSNTKSDMIRAVMEGITLESKDMYETMKKSGIQIKSLAITGGATKSPQWRQIIADMFGVEIKRLKVADATIIGATILAGVGAGIFNDAVEGAKNLVHFTDVITPNEKNVAKYNEIYQKYKNIYCALNKI